MKKWFMPLIVFLIFSDFLFSEELQLIKEVRNGALCQLDQTRKVLFLKGTPEEMGQAHGELLKDEIGEMYQRILVVAAGFAIKEKTSLSKRIQEVEKRTKSYVPQRFQVEMSQMAKSAQIDIKKIRELNYFPEMFHCSGIAVRGEATKDGQVRHVRVLDYMRDLGLQENAVLIVYQPSEYFSWLSVSYAGFIGTVTAMNEKGLAIGEMGGNGEGKWDGLPMSFLMRRIMEECQTVDEAILLMKSVPLTCDYYYILSDKTGNMAGVKAIAQTEEPVVVFQAGQEVSELPGALKDVVYISGKGERVETLFARLKDQYGTIDSESLIEIIKRPVSMKSNLHNAIFEPQTLNLWFAEAGKSTPACNEKYLKTNLNDLLLFFESLKKDNLLTK
ncbi:MAG: C45 family peptidase [Planctomycetia bacterium]|nr:C45 family peptidase [Planctomycetia bacterium]